GYLDNTLADGAQNVSLAISTTDNNALDQINKIVAADPQLIQVRLHESVVSGGLFSYYVGDVSPTLNSATSGPITSLAT
ncbi:type 1 fimbrial protein, partial [Klebsiella pneumoniae]|nr:type 1 fimbrial protein [Klebsiella pneumoniae]